MTDDPMARKRTTGRAPAGRGPAGDAATDRRYVMQFCGGLVLLVAVLVAASAVRATYRWVHRDAYARIEIDIENADRRGRRASAVVVATGARITVDLRDLMPPDGWSRGVSRLAVWHNPDATVTFGLRLLDERVVSVEKNPSLGSGWSAANRWMAAVLLAGAAAFLISRPYARRRGHLVRVS